MDLLHNEAQRVFESALSNSPFKNSLRQAGSLQDVLRVFVLKIGCVGIG